MEANEGELTIATTVLAQARYAYQLTMNRMMLEQVGEDPNQLMTWDQLPPLKRREFLEEALPDAVIMLRALPDRRPYFFAQVRARLEKLTTRELDGKTDPYRVTLAPFVSSSDVMAALDEIEQTFSADVEPPAHTPDFGPLIEFVETIAQSGMPIDENPTLGGALGDGKDPGRWYRWLSDASSSHRRSARRALRAAGLRGEDDD